MPPPPCSARGAIAEPAALLLRPERYLIAVMVAGLAIRLHSGVTPNLLALLQRGGLDAVAAVSVGAMLAGAGRARLADFALADRTNPLWIARGAVALMAAAFALLVLVGISFPVAAAFSIAFGAANGVMTITRGALPLMLFGAAGYGRVISRMARPALFVQASAPFVVALAVEHLSDHAVLELATLGVLAALGCSGRSGPAVAGADEKNRPQGGRSLSIG